MRATITENNQLIKAKTPEVFEAGKKAQEDAFWDIYQNFGNRKTYTNAFSYDGWTDETFKPKYSIAPTHCAQMFYSAKIKDIATAMKGLTFDFSKSSSFTSLCQSSSVEHFPTLNASVCNATDQSMVFHNCQKLHTIDLLIVAEHNTFRNWFSSCPALVNVRFDGEIGNNLSFKDSPLLSQDSIESIITHLADFSSTETGEYGNYAHTLTLSDAAWARFATEDPDTATSASSLCDFRKWNLVTV